MVNPRALVISVATAVLCALCFITISGNVVQAQRSLECQKVWDGPSDSNKVLSCLKNQDRIKSQWRYYIYPGFCALILLIVLFGFPIILLCRCCSCCAGCMQPHSPKNRAKARCWLYFWIVVALLWAIGTCVLIIAGANIMGNSAKRVVNTIDSGPLEYFNETKNTIKALLVDYSGTTPEPIDIDTSSFDDMITKFHDNIDVARNDYVKYFKIAQIVADCIGAVGVASILFILVIACCRCNGCCAVLLSSLYFVFALIFAILAVVFTVLMYFVTAGCGEVQLIEAREPGVGQWFLVPWCQSKFDFESLRSKLNDEVVTSSQKACDQLLQYCDNNEAYNPVTEDGKKKIFMCGDKLKEKTECTSLEKVKSVIDHSYIKGILSNTMCVNRTGWTYQEECTIAECAERCVDYQNPPLLPKTWSREISGKADFVLNVSAALSYVKPMLECSFVIDKFAQTIKSRSVTLAAFSKLGSGTECDNLHVSSVMLGTGFFVGTLMFMVGFYVLQRGSWVWKEYAQH